jgi:hypothetical protein
MFEQLQKLANDPNTYWHPNEHAYLLRWYVVPVNEEMDKLLWK